MVVPTLDQAIGAVVARFPEVQVAYLFGSVARGTDRPDSDLDVGVVYRRDAATEELHSRLAPLIASALARATGRQQVDVVDLAAQGAIFCLAVLTDGRLIHQADRRRRVDFEADTMSRAHDFRPTHEIATRGKVAGLRRWLRRRYDLQSDPIQARRPEGKPR